MILIYAEKPDMGTKIAAALDHITLSDGTKVEFDDIPKYERTIKDQRRKDGHFRIRYCGQDTIVTWGMGHMCELKQAEDYNEEYRNWQKMPLPYIPERYELKLIDSTKTQYEIIKALLSKADTVIVATDNDREGDLIADYLFTYTGYRKPYKRVLFNRQSAAEFRKAFAPSNLISSNERMPVINAGRARSAGDFIVGAGPTVAMTLYFPYKRDGKYAVLSVGRVQTATLDIIVERENEIRCFRPEKYYVVKGTFSGERGKYDGIYEEKKIPSKQDAEKILEELRNYSKCYVKDVVRTVSTKTKPHLYSMQSLQMDANKAYGMSLADTMKAAQSLYENGYTTYPRTDICHITTDSLPGMDKAIDAILTMEPFEKYSRKIPLDPNDKMYFDDAKCAKAGHCAIVPTGKIPQTISTPEWNIYTLIAKSVLCMVYPPAKIAKTAVTTMVDSRKFHTSGTEIVEMGYFEVLGAPKEADVPNVRKGENVDGVFRLEEKQTEPPKRYTDGTLLNAMITCGKTLEDEELKAVMAKGSDDKPRGLGRPSTQASIVERLLSRGYIVRKGKTIFPTDMGEYLIKNLPVPDLKSAVMTAQWEKRLDDIENGKDTYDSFMSDLEDSVRKWTNAITENGNRMQPPQNGTLTPIKCPLCGKPIADKGEFYGCTGYPACHFTISSFGGHKFNIDEVQTLLNGGNVFVENAYSKTKKKTFSCTIGMDSIEDGRMKFAFINDDNNGVETDIVCPLCGKPMVDRGDFYSCTGYPSCNFAISSLGGHKFSTDEIKALLNGGAVHVDNVYSKKKKKTFSCTIKLDSIKDGKMKFAFVDSGNYDGKDTGIKCPLCGKPIADKGDFYGCTGYPSCNFTIPSFCGHKFGVEEIKTLIDGGTVAVGDAYSKKYKKEFSCVIRSDGIRDGRMNFAYVNTGGNMETNVKCPLCGAPMKKSDKKMYCSDASKCGFTFPLSVFSPHVFTDKEVQDLINGKTVHIDNAYSARKKKNYSCDVRASIIDKSVKFDFA